MLLKGVPLSEHTNLGRMVFNFYLWDGGDVMEGRTFLHQEEEDANGAHWLCDMS